MCRARMAIRKCAVKKCKHRNRCMRRGSRAKPDERAQTTAMLSENAWTVDDLQPGPQTATARTTGTISLAAMWIWCHDSGHWTLNQGRSSLRAPQPQVPDASDQKECAACCGGKMVLPFHCGRKHDHHWMSDWNCLFRRTWWCWHFGTDIVSINRLMNVLPGMTTDAAWLSEPTRDCSCLFVATLFPLHSRTMAVMRASLSGGRLSSILIVSIWMPRKVSWQLGPSVLCAAIGTPSSLQAVRVRCIAIVHSAVSGGPNNKKSSK